MKLTLLAATGGIGRLILDQALAAGHDVTVVVRNPANLAARVPAHITDLASPDPAVLDAAVSGADAVLSGLGARTRAEAGVATVGTKAVIRAIQAAGVRRLVVVSAAPVATTPSPSRPRPKHDPGDDFVTRHLRGPAIKAIFRRHYADLATMEDAVAGSGLDWTIVRPPRLTDGPLTAAYRTAIGRNVTGGTSISRADAAHLMLDVLRQPATVGQVVGIAY